MRKIISLVLSLLLVSQSALVYAQGAPSAGNIDYSIYKDMMIDGSFYNIPRSSRMMVDSECAGDMEQKRLCDEFIATYNPTLCADPACARKYIKCTKVYGAYNHNPESICLQYYKYGVDRAKAWDAYRLSIKNEEGEYYNLSPSEIYDKYEQVAKDIAHLWNINPEYVEEKRDEKIIAIVTGIGILSVAVYAGLVVSPILQKAGLGMSAQIASVLPLKAAESGGGILGFLRSLVGAFRTGKFLAWADLGLSVGWIITDTVFVGSTYEVVFDLYEGLYSMQDHVDTDLAVRSRNLLAEIIKTVSKVEEEYREIQELKQEKNAEEIAALKLELREEIEKALQERDWGNHSWAQTEAVVTLYALEYIRAEMADMSDPERYREAAIDLVQLYFSPGEMTDLERNRAELFFLAAEARAAAAKNKKYEVQQKILKHVLGDKWVMPYALKYYLDNKRNTQGDQNEND